jgi:cell division septal protein FtsQ
MTPRRDGRSRKIRRNGRLALLAVLAGLALMVWLLPAFHAGSIEISGLQTLGRDEVLTASGLAAGQHLLREIGGSPRQLAGLRYGSAEDKIRETFPVVRDVTARLSFPGKILLQVVERVQVAYVAIPDGCVMIDKEGVAIRILPAAPAGIPVIEGITVTSLVLGKPLAVDVPEAMNSAISLMGAIIDADKDSRTSILLLPQISRIRPLSGRHLYLTVILPSSGSELYVEAESGGDMADDMLWLRFALDQHAFAGLGKGVLDLTGNRRTFTPDQ